MPRAIAAIVLLVVTGPPARAEDFPHAVIKNEKLTFTLYDADASKGFYRGTRFDHAGVFGSVEFAGHKVFGPWKGTHDPANHDDIVGPCEEFGIDTPLGYDAAKAGGTFLKIGVGELEKPKEAKYSFAHKYKIVAPVVWERRPIDPEADFVGEIPRGARDQIWRTGQKANGYAYSYSKVVYAAGATIGLTHRLKNTGEKRIVTDCYNHNFFNVDGDPVGPNYSLVFSFEPKAKDLKGKFGDLVELKGNEFRFKDTLPNGADLMATLTGFDAKEKKPWFEMRHAPSGVRVKVECDYPLAKFNVWGIKPTICPEPYLAIDLKPGEEVKWSVTYTFTHDLPKK
ncbi:aldose 1-epimerase [Frigoriglobus tundricola]|uniref:Uncharacterized protein n=1 Tax=Frigoriglobus tundricola TaxID=2774151 RepID=A0A6M5YTT9_9BACT|nr:aldose 1-epimerase [Frigoriglobus tundricola]QJW97507.1 hypothetical protein FTUN_5081 [Frigoriglobus tundricola]